MSAPVTGSRHGVRAVHVGLLALVGECGLHGVLLPDRLRRAVGDGLGGADWFPATVDADIFTRVTEEVDAAAGLGAGDA